MALMNRLIGTEATVSSGAYQRVFGQLAPAEAVEVIAQACPRFVEFVERGDTTSPELIATAEGYLALLRVARVDTLILGCTHYPLLRAALHHVMGEDVLLVSSADETANSVYEELRTGELLREDGSPPQHRFESSGDADRFAALITHFMAPKFHRVALVPAESGSRWS